MSLWVVVAEEEEDSMVVIVVEGIVITMALAASAVSAAPEIVSRRSIGEKFVNVYHSTK
ncbi:hypothetical protein H1196_05885 [Brevibacillus halotolerans]|nr:hypothetical protein [Brevibacillus halotolerans]